MYTPEIKELTEIILTHKRNLIYNVDTTRSILILDPDISGSEVREAILKLESELEALIL